MDTLAGQLRLPQPKLQWLLSMLEEWGDRKCCSRRELESQIGHLNTDSTQSTPLVQVHSPERGLPVRPRMVADIHCTVEWCLLPASAPSREWQVTSGSWGCGAWHGHSWFQVRWDERSHHLSIAEKELIPIIIACVVCGRVTRFGATATTR